MADRNERPALDNMEDCLGYIEQLEARLADSDDDEVEQWPVVIDLDEPLTHGKVGPVHQIIIREPCLGDMRGIKLNINEVHYDDLIQLVARLSSQPMPLLNKLPNRHAARAIGVARRFFLSCLTQ